MIQRLTKIVATIGPSVESDEMIERLLRADVDAFRLNFKHNTVDWHKNIIKKIRQISERIKSPVAIIIDLQGPNLRMKLNRETIKLKKNDKLRMYEEGKSEQSEPGFSISPDVVEYLSDGDEFSAADGQFLFKVEKINGKKYARTKSQGELLNNKSVNIPGGEFDLPILVKRDFEGLQLAAEMNLDFIALSFVRTKQDLKTVRQQMKKYRVKSGLISKIETKKALDNLDDIVWESDGVMVARGDLALELGVERVPYYQRQIIRKAVEASRPVIVATQMLQSMIDNPYPTRAEVSDLANAAYDLTDAVMLSGESATGSYPLQTIKVMKKTVEYNERQFSFDTHRRYNFVVTSEEAMVCEMAYGIYRRFLREQPEKLAGFVVFTQEGKTARFLSRFRPQVPIYAFVPDMRVRGSLFINFGVISFLRGEIKVGNEIGAKDVLNAIDFLKKRQRVDLGHKLIVLHGDVWAKEEGTTTVKVVKVR